MTRKDLQGKTKEELIDIVESLYSSPYIEVYFSVKAQTDKLAKKIEDAEINFLEDTAPFKNFILWSKESLTIMDNLEKILSKIDRDILAKAKEKRLAAPETSLESYIGKNHDKGGT
jgi:hypothetical protein